MTLTILELPMSDRDPHFLTPAQLREKVIARWENEGGATRSEYKRTAILADDLSTVGPLTEKEMGSGWIGSCTTDT